jgi:hypothetical protein
MRKALPNIITVAFALLVTLGTADARQRHKARHTHRAAPVVTRDYDGTPIIMQGFPERRRTVPTPPSRADRPVHIPRGSGTYIPPPNPSPNSPNSPPAAVLLQQPPAAVKPAPLNSFSDRVTNCIHSFPLQGGIGNNPSNQQAYVRQCAN